MKKKIIQAVSRIAVSMEIAIAVVILFVILIGAVLLVRSIALSLAGGLSGFSVNQFLTDALALVIGIEFVKMLVKHTPGAVIEVLLFAIARQLIVIHSSPLDTLIGVVAVAAIFAVRKYLLVPFDVPHVGKDDLPLAENNTEKER